MIDARLVRVRGVVQGVGFRPFVYRLARAHGVTGWVLNGTDGVRIHAEGAEDALRGFLRELEASPPRAASIDAIEVAVADVGGFTDFLIRASDAQGTTSARISPDLPVCDRCVAELLDPADRRAGYPYINCTDCGPRFSIIHELPYDRAQTTMSAWTMCEACAREYDDPHDRRFHAQPIACAECGPHYAFVDGEQTLAGDTGSVHGAIDAAIRALREGSIVAMKGIGGYHLVCDARAPESVRALRERKFRKDRPFAIMARDLETASATVHLSTASETLLTSVARPIVLAPSRVMLPFVAPGTRELGIMLPYTPLQHLLFARGAPALLVVTSANRSSEPIAYRDDEAHEQLSGIASAFLVGARPIARRVDDSVARAGVLGPVILRRARGYAPAAAARLASGRPILAVGSDLKNAVTLVVDGEAFVSQHLGDLVHHASYLAFEEAVHDLTRMYRVQWTDLVLVHDLHPQFASTAFALKLPCAERRAVQHHRAHIASVLAEHGALEAHVIGAAFDGTGYGDDGTIWGGEFFAGSVATGLRRVAHLRPASLPGGDAAARWPVQAAAGFLSCLNDLPVLASAPFSFPERYRNAQRLIECGVRTFTTTSVGRLFDAMAAIAGYTGEVTYEGQAAIWLEQSGRDAGPQTAYSFPFVDGVLDFRPALVEAIDDRVCGRTAPEIARAFHAGLALGIADALEALCATERTLDVVLSGGVFQNELLLEDLVARLSSTPLRLRMNRIVPPNDGGISLGQAALALN
ncbi:MAG: carbamoyltransferase HypF [Gemmatimonadota bacterium]